MKNKNNMEVAILIYSNYIPSKTIGTLKEMGIEIFYILPKNLAAIIEEIELNMDNQEFSDEEIYSKLNPIFDWINQILKKEKKNKINISIENYSIQLIYNLYSFIKNNDKLKLVNDIQN